MYSFIHIMTLSITSVVQYILLEFPYCHKISGFVFLAFWQCGILNKDCMQSVHDGMSPGSCLNIKTVFPRYGDSHVKDKTVTRIFLLQYRNSRECVVPIFKWVAVTVFSCGEQLYKHSMSVCLSVCHTLFTRSRVQFFSDHVETWWGHTLG